jgi:hypothetical protein
MKKNQKILLIISGILIAFQGWAQDSKILRDAVVMKDNKLMSVTKDGQFVPMEEDNKQLDNGIIVMKSGEYKLPTGQRMKLKNGEILNSKGQLLLMMDQVVNIDGMMMKDGKMMVVKDGTLSPMDSDMNLNSADKATKDGLITKQDGSTIQLREGEMINMDGTLMRRKDEMMAMDGVTMRNGKMMKYDNGRLIPMDKEITMPSGKVGLDGTVTLKDGSKVILKDGDIMSQKGELAVAKSDLLMDGLLKRDGKMMQLDKGKMKALNSEITLGNGAKISPEGNMIMAGNNKVILKEGDFVTMQGDVMMMKGSKLDSKGMESRISNDHLIFTGGRMMVVKNGEPQGMTADMTMPNGNKVMKNGQIVKKDASKYILREGEKVDMTGEIIVDKAKIEMDEKNNLVMKNGKMMEIKNGKELPMTKEVLMPNWDKVMVDGTIEKSNGTKYAMKEGERVNMEGEMMSKINTGFTPGSTTTAAAGSDCVTMKNGKMCMIKEGKELPMAKEVLMPNGNKVMTNGAILMKDGKIVVMKEGDKMDMSGNLALKK